MELFPVCYEARIILPAEVRMHNEQAHHVCFGNALSADDGPIFP